MNDAQATFQSTLTPMSFYSDAHPYFEPMHFCSRVSDMYVNIQRAKTNRQFFSVRDYFTTELFAKLNKQLNDLAKTGRRECVENISVLSVKPMGWKKEGGSEVVYLQLTVRIVNYIIAESTGMVVQGSKTDERTNTYEWEMLHLDNPSEKRLNNMMFCPQCSAPWKQKGAKRCEYCGHVVQLTDDIWQIRSIKRLS